MRRRRKLAVRMLQFYSVDMGPLDFVLLFMLWYVSKFRREQSFPTEAEELMILRA